MGISRRSGRRGCGAVFCVHRVNCGGLSTSDRFRLGRGGRIEAPQVRFRSRMPELGNVEKLPLDRSLTAACATGRQRCFRSDTNLPPDPWGEQLDLIGHGIRVRLDFLDNCARLRSRSLRYAVGDIDGQLRGLRERLSWIDKLAQLSQNWIGCN